MPLSVHISTYIDYFLITELSSAFAFNYRSRKCFANIALSVKFLKELFQFYYSKNICLLKRKYENDTKLKKGEVRLITLNNKMLENLKFLDANPSIHTGSLFAKMIINLQYTCLLFYIYILLLIIFHDYSFLTCIDMDFFNKFFWTKICDFNLYKCFWLRKSLFY